MEKENNKKKTNRTNIEEKTMISRIHRIEGQVKGIEKMIEDKRYCDDILIQLSAINKSVKSLANYILENHMYSCILPNIEKGKIDAIDEVINLFKRFQ